MFKKIIPICLAEYSTIYGSGNSVFHNKIIRYEQSKTDLKKLLREIGAGKGKGFAIARTMNIDKFCEFISDPKNQFTTRIKAGDTTLVGTLSDFSSSAKKHCFSAATKICTLWRESLELNNDCAPVRPAPFVIADSFVRDALININASHPFTKFDIASVYSKRQYENWRRIILDFKQEFGLNEFSERDIDKTLWIVWSKFLKRPLINFVREMADER